MSNLGNKASAIQKEIQIQPIIHKEIQPVITIKVQPMIEEEIIPVIHKEIQPIIHQEIQPVITKEIQIIIHKKIQPVIFMENQKNIEEVIQQLEQSQTQIIEDHTTQREVAPRTETKVQHQTKRIIIPYIWREEKHINKIELSQKTERIEKHIEKIDYVPYIKYKNGDILPYEKKVKNIQIKSSIENTKLMEKIIAVNFISLNDNITFPMACKKTDIFSNIEERLYREYPILKSKKIYFIVNGNVVDKSLTLEQNKIKNGNSILINEFENIN